MQTERDDLLPFKVVVQARRILGRGQSLKAAADYLYVSTQRLDRSLWHWIARTEEVCE